MLLLVLMPVQWYFLLFFYNCTSKVTKKNNTYNKKLCLVGYCRTCTPYFFGISFYAFTKRVSRSCLEIWFCTEFCEYRNKIQKRHYYYITNCVVLFLCISSNRMIVLSISESLHKRVEFAKG